MGRGDTPAAAAGLVKRRRGLDAAVAVVLALVALLAYLRTMRPTFGWGDSSELITAAYHLGIGHSPGYPTWMLLAHPFSRLPIGDVAFRVNFMTALVGSGAVAILYLVYVKVSGSRTAAAIAALSFAFAATFWDQTTEAEVYTLHVGLAAAIILTVLAWRATGRDRWLSTTAWLVGLSLGNHALTALMIPPILGFVWAERGRRFFTARRAAVWAGLFLLGVSVYLYLPIRAAANPPPHLNNPGSAAQLWAHLTAPGARASMFDSGWRLPLQRAVRYTWRLTGEFTLAGCALALVGIAALWRRDRKALGLLASIALLNVAYSVNFSIFDIYVYFLPLQLVWAAFISVGAAVALAAAARLTARLPERLVSPAQVWRYGPATAALLILPATQFGANLPRVDGSRDLSSERFARAVFEQVEPGAAILADWWTIAPMGYLRHIEGQRRDVVMFAAPSMPTDEDFLALTDRQFLAGYPAVYFVEALTNRMDLMPSEYYLVPEGPVYRVLLDRPAPDTLLADIPATPVARFGDRVGLARADLADGPLRSGECFDLTLYWTPLEGFNGRDHQVIVLLESEEHGRIWQESAVLGHALYPAERWRPGEVLVERRRVYLSEPAPPGGYSLYLRLRQAGVSQALACDQPAAGRNARDYLLGRVVVAEPAPVRGDRERMPALVAMLRR